MRSKSSAKAANANSSRGATPNITGISSSGPKPNGRRGPRPNGWPITDAQIDNLRAALDWAFSPDGDASIGVALTAAAVPLWMHLSLMDECRGRVERALAAIAAGASRDARREMKLHAALGASLMYTRGAVPEIGAAWTKALEIAESLDDAEYQLRSLWGLWSFHISSGQYRIALALAQRFCTLAADRSDPNDRLIGERLIGIVAALSGRPSQRAAPSRTRARSLCPFRPEVAHRSLSARPAGDGARLSCADPVAAGVSGSGDARRRKQRRGRSARPITQSRCVTHWPWRHVRSRCGSAIWPRRNITWRCCSTIRRGMRWRSGAPLAAAIRECSSSSAAMSSAGLRLLRAGFDELGEARSAAAAVHVPGVMAEALGRAGQIADGLAVIEEAIVRSERTEERWVIAELLRIKGELLLLQGAPGAAAAAEDHFRQALDWARRQGALSWELRAAMSLARLLRDQGRSADAMALLQPVYDRFTEGFDTADLKAAKALLGALAEPNAPRTCIA